MTNRLPRPIDDQARNAAEQEEVGEQLLASQKMATAGGVAHDINNILMIIVMQADLLLEDLSADDPARSRVKEIIEAVDRGSALIHPLLASSRRQPAEARLTQEQDASETD